jgi:catechol 2,3-dioxygenase-like lactoylglutathione lyase family enzyme
MCQDLEQTAKIFKVVFDAKEVHASQQAKFFLVKDLWVAVLKGQSLKERSYNHLAFKIEEADLEELTRRVKSLGLELCQDKERLEGEGKSLYFYDFDNHLFEFHTGTLTERLQTYVQQKS